MRSIENARTRSIENLWLMHVSVLTKLFEEKKVHRFPSFLRQLQQIVE